MSTTMYKKKIIIIIEESHNRIEKLTKEMPEFTAFTQQKKIKSKKKTFIITAEKRHLNQPCENEYFFPLVHMSDIC